MRHLNSKIVIVYNADSGWLNAVVHGVHKALKPSTYPCSLCALTYGLVAMRHEWRQFLATLPFEAVFHHRDDFALAYPDANPDFPAILLADGNDDNGAPEVLISASELDQLQALNGLTALVQERVAEKMGSQSLVRASE